MIGIRSWLPALLLFATALSAQASLVDDINRLRTKGCGNYAVAPTRLQSSRDLDAVARAWSGGGRLAVALKKTHYPATNSASMRVEGSRNDAMILRVLAQNYCETITGRDFTEIGLYRRDDNVWVVVAARFSPPRVKDAARVSEEVLGLVNAARSKPRRCGSKSFEAAPPVTLSATLAQAALIHAQDMAAHDHFQHEGTDGSKPSERLTRVGYQWRSAAENIALGPTTARQVMEGWLASPGHCANIMSPRSTQMGLAYTTTPGGGDIYWAQEFAAPM